MFKLISADFHRLWKSKTFLLLCIITLFISICFCVSGYNNFRKIVRLGINEHLLLNVYRWDNVVFTFNIFMGFISAILCSVYIGTEYSDGGIRNKITLGHSRLAIYMSHLLVVTAACSILLFSSMALLLIAGIPVYNGGRISASEFLLKVLISIMIVVSFCSIFTFISMICANRTGSAVLCLLITFIMFYYGFYCIDLTTASKEIQIGTVRHDITGEEEIIMAPNPYYPSKTKIKLYKNILNITPMGQAIVNTESDSVLENISDVSDFKRMPLYSLGICVIFTGIGIFLFWKKNLN